MFFKWLARKIRTQEYEETIKPYSAQQSLTVEPEDDDEPIRFELTTAVGGRILRVRRYDRRKHESDCQVYVIPQGDDVGERVSKILNLELIK